MLAKQGKHALDRGGMAHCRYLRPGRSADLKHVFKLGAYRVGRHVEHVRDQPVGGHDVRGAGGVGRRGPEGAGGSPVGAESTLDARVQGADCKRAKRTMRFRPFGRVR